uniref:Uncharacterized protein n=1 Tax=Rhizophora mucronata TaxID=61149 RepID=A0A2P2Q6D0_RHIMU
MFGRANPRVIAHFRHGIPPASAKAGAGGAPPVALVFQGRNDRFQGPAWRVPVRDHELTDLGRTQCRSALKNLLHLGKQLVILDSQVTIRQCLERREITQREMDMDINPTRSE